MDYLTFLKKAQSLGTYSLLLGIVAASLISMQTYVKRALQARYKRIVDAGSNVWGLRQYEPPYINSTINQTTLETIQTVYSGGNITYNYLSPQMNAAGEYIRGNIVSRQGRQIEKFNLTYDDEWENYTWPY